MCNFIANDIIAYNTRDDNDASLLLYNVTLHYGDICDVPESGDWSIDAADNCVITDTRNVNGNSVICTGTGSLTIASGGIIENFDILAIHDPCILTCRNTAGCFG